MIKYLTVLGIFLVVLGGSLAALSNPDAAAVQEDVGRESQPDTAEPEATAIATAEPVTNREDCAEIRGTDYLSREERTWFLANCVRR
jgi:hypothetical protein